MILVREKSDKGFFICCFFFQLLLNVLRALGIQRRVVFPVLVGPRKFKKVDNYSKA